MSVWRNPEIDRLHAEWRRNAGLAMRIGKTGIVIMVALAIPISIWFPRWFVLPIGLGGLGMSIGQFFWSRGDRAYERMQALRDMEITEAERRYIDMVN